MGGKLLVAVLQHSTRNSPPKGDFLLAALYSSASLVLASQALSGKVISFLSPAGQTKSFSGSVLNF